MQTQQRPSQQTQPVAKQPTIVKPANTRSAPAELDVRALRQVSGAGTTDGPHKGW